jgi:tetratricopeptide (TPR) repeat protein
MYKMKRKKLQLKSNPDGSGDALYKLSKKKAIEPYHDSPDLYGLNDGDERANADAYFNKGNILYAMSEFRRALLYYNKVISISNGLGCCYIDAYLNKSKILENSALSSKEEASICNTKLQILLPKLYDYIKEMIKIDNVANIILSYATGFGSLGEVLTDILAVASKDSDVKTSTIINLAGEVESTE